MVGAAPGEARLPGPRLGSSAPAQSGLSAAARSATCGKHAHPANSAAAAAVRSTCSGVWASEGMSASNCDGAM